MYKLILAEKPSVCRDIARVIGANAEKSVDSLKYYEGNGYLVSNFRGHLVGLCYPKEYPEFQNNKPPIFPKIYKFKAKDDCISHVKSLEKLMKSSDVSEIICATDAGREGELIFRYVYNFIGCTKPFSRLWISSLTDESIKNGMQNLLDGQSKDTMFEAGFARSKIDWLIGMNLSYLYHVAVGRVMTPTLRMIVDRDLEILNFKKAKYYTLQLQNGAEYFVENGENTFAEKSKADNFASRLNGQKATVKSVEKRRKSEQRPLLHSLTSLQKEANEKHGLTAEQTLNALQNLYEKKLTTYPRTDSNCITEDMQSQIPQLVKAVEFFDTTRVNSLISSGLCLDKRVVDNSKVSDHHAVIPTLEVAKSFDMDLKSDEKTVLNLVINRFLTALSQPHFYDETRYVFDVLGETFLLISKETVSLGWREFDGKKSSAENSKSSKKSKIAYCQGESFIAEVSVLETETAPPKPFTESTLLSAMENISRRISEKEKAEFVKERGLGTPATRAGIIEKLISKNKKGLSFIERKGKNLVSTEFGKTVILALPETIKSVELSADMEEKLADIENGKCRQCAVLDEFCTWILKQIETKNSAPQTSFYPQKEREILGKCPKCGANIFEVDNAKLQAFCCENKECKFILWKKQFGKKISADNAKSLLRNRRTPLIKGFISTKTGKNFDAMLVLKDDFSVGCEFEKK